MAKVLTIEDDAVTGRVEDPVDGQRQLDHTQVGAEMTAARRTGAHQLVADLAGEHLELGVVEGAEVTRPRDLLQQSHRLPLVHDPVGVHRV